MSFAIRLYLQGPDALAKRATRKIREYNQEFLFFLFLRAPFRLSSAVPVHEYNGLRAEQAACEQGAASACGEDLVEVGRHSRIAIVSTRRQLEQRRREGAHGGDSQDAGPALDPSCICSSPERRREAGRTVSCQVAEEGGSFSSEAPAYLDPNNDEARPSRARELGVSLSPFAAGGGVDGSARAGVGARLRLAGARDRADDCGIERELRSVPERQASLTGTSMFMSATRTLRATRAPPSRQTRATACSSGRARDAKTPDVAHAERWSGCSQGAEFGGRASCHGSEVQRRVASSVACGAIAPVNAAGPPHMGTCKGW